MFSEIKPSINKTTNFFATSEIALNMNPVAITFIMLTVEIFTSCSYPGYGERKDNLSFTEYPFSLFNTWIKENTATCKSVSVSV